MFVLSIDTCDARGSVALLRDGSVLQMVRHDSPEEYSSWLLPAVGELLQGNAISMKDVAAYAVAVGPGSFTGVRVGLTTVKAWAEVYGKPIAPVSRLEAVASQAGRDGPVAAFLAGSRGQIFGALYGSRDGKRRLMGEETVMEPESFLQSVEESAGGRKIWWISTDPERIEATAGWKAASGVPREPIQRVSPFLAEAIGMIGYQKVANNETVNGVTLDANYVRRPDAEIFWKGAEAAKTP